MTTNHDALREAFNAFLMEQHERHKHQHNHFHVARNEWARRTQSTQYEALAASKPAESPLPPNEQWYRDSLHAARASTPEPQAQAGEPTGCACRWDKDDNRVQTCERHQGWLDVVHEWAERAKSAEAQIESDRKAVQENALKYVSLFGELQDAQEAIAKKDAALLACVEAAKLVRELGARFFSMPRSVSARADFEIALNATGRAITQTQEALK